MMHYEIIRDEQGLPTKMVWLGCRTSNRKQLKAELDAAKLAEYEATYGKRAE